MPLLRVSLEGVDDPETDRLLMQLRMTDGGDPLHDEVILGFCGDSSDEGNRYPFVLLPDGTLDFGTCVRRRRRFWNFQWGDRIEEGKGAVVTDSGVDYAYRITRMDAP